MLSIYGYFLVVLQHGTNHNIETADQISMKFVVDITLWTVSCLICIC